MNILVNNAGIMTNSPLIEQSVKEWDQVMAVNLRGPFLMAKHFVPLMEASQSPAIINIGSIESFLNRIIPPIWPPKQEFTD